MTDRAHPGPARLLAHARRHAAICALASGPVPPVVTLAGTSMEPSIPLGARVRVVPVSGPLHRGDVVLVESGASRVLHRVVHVVRDGDATLVFHAGDASGAAGVVPREAILGRAVAILSPEGLPFPTPDRLELDVLARLDRASRRSRVYSRLREISRAKGVRRLTALRSLGGAVLRSLLT